MSVEHDTIGEYLAEHEPVLALWHRLSEIVGGEGSEVTSIEGLTLPAATVYLVGIFEGQVVKGGFGEFLRDRSGDFAGDTLQALREVGAHVCVELLEKALAAFPGGVAPTRRLDRLLRLEQVDPSDFEPFDALFNEHVDSQSPHRLEKVDALLRDYMEAHAEVRLTY